MYHETSTISNLEGFLITGMQLYSVLKKSMSATPLCNLVMHNIISNTSGLHVAMATTFTKQVT